MHCPQCDSSSFNPVKPCPNCNFTGDVVALERFSNLSFLLAELATWSQAPLAWLNELQAKYEKQRRQVEVGLGLRHPPPTAGKVPALQSLLAKFYALLNAVVMWQQRGWIDTAVADKVRRDTHRKINEIEERLLDVDLPEPVMTSEKRQMRRLAQLRFVLAAAQKLYRQGEITETAHEAMTSSLTLAIVDLEIKVGIHERPQPAQTTAPVSSSPPGEQPLAATAPPVPPPADTLPRTPWTWDRFWETLLSERTLQVILFLGTLLLFASGVSWVVWNWDTFAPVVQVSFLSGFTAVFYGLGWYVRNRMQLRGSGIALSAVASLMVPLDFYAFYLSGGFPPDSWPIIWLLASGICFLAYLLTAVLVRAQFFSYLVGVALGSIVTATLNLLHVHIDWWQTGIAGTALVLTIAGEICRLWPETRRIFTEPCQHLALASAIAVMFLGLGWGFIAPAQGDAFYIALAVDWWLGGLVMALMVRRVQLRSLVWGMALSFPVAMWLSQRILFTLWMLPPVWHAFGWALLVPVYLLVGRWWERQEPAAVYGRIVLQTGLILGVISAIWSLLDVHVVAIVHPFLALTMILATILWQRARYLWGMSLLLATGVAAWQGSRGTTPAELVLPWTLLSILHIAIAVGLRSHLFTDKPGFRKYTIPLFGSGYLLAGLSLLPPLVLFDHLLLTYALTNWMGINGWLAYLAHNDSDQLQALFIQLRLRRLGVVVFHWGAALAMVPWVWLLWTNGRPPVPSLAFAYIAVAWGTLGCCVWLRRVRWRYGRPWQMAAHLSHVMAVMAGFATMRQPQLAILLMLVAIFYFVAAWVLRNRHWFSLAGILLPIGSLLALDHIGVPDEQLNPVLAGIVLAYMAGGGLLETYRGLRRPFLEPLYTVALLWTALLVVLNVYLTFMWADDALVWVGLSQLLLGVGLAIIAWLRREAGWAHLGVWLWVYAGGLFVKAYSQGSGISAPLAALLAIGLVVTERGLRQLALRAGLLWRRAWRLYRQPLLAAGWIVSAAVIGLALVRNLFILGGGTGQQTWAIVALLLIVGLYAVSARLFRRTRFVWLASGLLFFPWTLLTYRGWYLFPVPDWPWYSVSWLSLALLLQGTGIVLAWRVSAERWGRPAMIVAHFLVPFALVWSAWNLQVSSVSFGLAILFYGTAVWIDAHFRSRTDPANPRFLYVLIVLLPVWAIYLLQWGAPRATITHSGLLLLAFTLPMLAVGRWMARREPTYRWPLYLGAYGTAVVATMLVSGELPILIGLLLFDTALAILSVWLFREPMWWYPATITLPWAAVLLLAQFGLSQTEVTGWLFIGLGGSYVLVAWALTQLISPRYAMPLLVMMFALVTGGVALSSETEAGILIGYGAAAVVLGATAVWKRWPFVWHMAIGLMAAWYISGLLYLDVGVEDFGLLLWPGIIAGLTLAWVLDEVWGMEADVDGERHSARNSARNSAFPWHQLEAWPGAVWQRVAGWWALSAYGMAFAAVAISGLVTAFASPARWVLALALGTVAYAWGAYRFRLRGWLWLAWGWAEVTALALIHWLGFVDSRAELALAFMPMTLLTAVAGLIVEQVRREEPFVVRGRIAWDGWSRPFYLWLFMNLGIGQLMALSATGAGTAVTFLNGLIIAVLATVWSTSWLIYLPLLLWLWGMGQFLFWRGINNWPVALALSAIVYGIPGYWLRYRQRSGRVVAAWLHVWERPLRLSGWVVSLAAMGLVFISNLGLSDIVFRALMGRPLLSGPAEALQIQRFALVLAILGLFYLIAAVTDRRHRLAYAAVFLLLGAWSVWLRLLQGQRELQLYAMPAGFYLLATAWAEWEWGQRDVARWIDRAAILLLFGSLFWQSFGELGGLYALVMVVEGLVITWMGSMRRIRRLLYAGVVGVVLAVSGQLIEPLLSLNTFALLLLGALLVALGIGLERRLEKVRVLSRDLRARLERWE